MKRFDPPSEILEISADHTWLHALSSAGVFYRGTFQAENLSVSASTIFVVGAMGELYTRLYDFDTAGENDTLTYSFLSMCAPSGSSRVRFTWVLAASRLRRDRAAVRRCARRGAGSG